MKNSVYRFVAACVASLALSAQAWDYTLIPYTEAMKATGSSEYESARGFIHAIDGSGLTVKDGVYVHTETYSGNMWMSKNVTLSESSPKFYCVDLGETYRIGQIKIWNYNQSGQQSRGFKATEIYTTDDETAAKGSVSDVRAWGSAVWTGELSKATGANDKGCAPITFAAKNARYVAFVCTSSWGDTGYQGLSEVRFFTVPEGLPVLANTSVALNAGNDGFAASATLDADSYRSDLTALAYTAEDAEPVRIALGAADPGETKSGALSGLTENQTYAVRFEAANELYTMQSSVADQYVIYTGTPTLTWKADGEELGTVPAEVTVARAAADPYPLEVRYSISSEDGVEGTDYNPVSGVVTIPANETSAVIQVVPIVNSDKTSDVHVTVALEAGTRYLKSENRTVEVAIANASVPTTANVWLAGASSDGLASTAGNWSKGVPRADNPESLVILVDGNYSTKSMVWDANGTSELTSTVMSWTQSETYPGTVTFKTTFPVATSSFKTFTVTGDMVVNGGTITHPVSAVWDDQSKDISLAYLRDSYTYRLDLAAASFTLGVGAKITAAGKGHSWLRNKSNVKGCVPSHGGRYESTTIGCYGNPKYPEDVGLASNLGTDSLAKCAVGGGAVKLTVTGSCVIDGEIDVDGKTSSGSLAAGAAGSVLIEAARVTGSGVIHADGIYCGNSGQINGTGGRIALLTTDPVDVSTLTVRAGGSGTGKYAPEGTVYLKDASMTNGILYLNNPLYTSANATPNRGAYVTNEKGVDWTFDGIRLNGHVNLYVTDGTTLTLPNGFASVTAPNNNSGRVSGLYYRGGTIDVGSGAQTIAGGAWYFYPSVAYAFPNDLTIDGGAAIGSSSYWEMASLSNGAAPTSAWKVLFSVAGDLTITENGTVTANTAGLGQQSGSQYTGVAIGAHGGRRSATGTTMDSVFTPHLPGVFQSNSYGYVKAGGVIDFTVDGCLRVDGKVVSDSPDTADGGRGHAAGGAINITAGTIAGAATGRISAKASRDVQCGGRVAVKLTKSGATFDDYAGSFNVKGGGSLTGSSAGSVYLQAGAEDDKAGTIIIDNFNANGVSTPICATGYDADQVVDFKKASLVVRNKGYAQVSVADENNGFKMKTLMIDGTSKIDLNGKTLTVSKAVVNNVKLSPGTYTAAQVATAAGEGYVTGEGSLVVTGSGLVLFLK